MGTLIFFLSMMIMVLGMMLCISNLNVFGLKFTKHASSFYTAKPNYLEVLNFEDLSKVNETKLDKITEILEHLINKANNSLVKLQNKISNAEHIKKEKEKEYETAKDNRLLAEQKLGDSDIKKTVDDAYTASNEANQTAKNAKQSYIKAKNVQITQSDAVKVDIASLKAIKKIVFLLLTGTHQPTASPTPSPTRSPTVSLTLSPTTTSQVVALQAGCPQSISYQFVNGKCYTKALTTSDFVNPGTGTKNCGPIESYCQQQGGSLADKTDTHTWLNNGNEGNIQGRPHGVTSTRDSANHHWLTDGLSDFGWSDGLCDHPNRFFICVAPLHTPTQPPVTSPTTS